MKEQLYKNIALSFVVINIWTLYNFFDYYNDLTHDQWGLSGMTLFFNFMGSVYIGIAVGILAILLRITVFRNQKQAKLKNNFLYVSTGFLNLNFLTIWIISIVMGFLPLKTEAIYFMSAILLISVFILVDIFQKEKSDKIEFEKA